MDFSSFIRLEPFLGQTFFLSLLTSLVESAPPCDDILKRWVE